MAAVRMIQAPQTEPSDSEAKEESAKRLSKRLAYILRYGALKEGLDVDDNGFVELEDLCNVELLQKHHTPAEIFEAIKSSISYRNTNRYDYRQRDGKIYVRAAYLRNFEKNPFHGRSNVKTLFESSMGCIINNLDDYDLEDFPDEHILRLMIRRLKREKRLTTRALRVLLAPTLTCLDLEGVYLTGNTMRLVWEQCPHLMAVSLKDCGYIMTDTMLARFAKNLPKLEKLNLCLCTHLTDRALTTMAKQLPHLNTLHMARVPSLTAQGVLKFVRTAPSMRFLDVYDLRVTLEDYRSLTAAASEKSLTLILREPRKSQMQAQECLDSEGSENASVTSEGNRDGHDVVGRNGDEDGVREDQNFDEELAIAAGLYEDGWLDDDYVDENGSSNDDGGWDSDDYD